MKQALYLRVRVLLGTRRETVMLGLLDFGRYRIAALLRLAPRVIKVILLALFGYLKVDSVWNKEPVLTGDGHIWADVASNPLFSRDFLLPSRPLALPLICKLIESDLGVVRLQVVIATLAWGALAYALSRLVSGFPSLLLFAGTLALGLGSPAHSWDVVIRSESTAHSFLLLTLACAISFLVESRRSRRRAWAYAAMTIHFALWCAFARDSSTYLLILTAFAIGGSLWLTARKHTSSRTSLIGGAVIVGACLIFSGLSQWNLRESKRYEFPLMNVIFRRVLRSEEKRDYFAHELAMPLSREVRNRRGKWASSDKRYAFESPKLADFRQWLRSDGYQGYQRYLLTHFPTTWNEAYESFDDVLKYRGHRSGVRTAATVVTPWVDEYTTRGLLPAHPGGFCLASLLLGGAALIFARSPWVKVLGLFGITLVLGTLSQLYICYHGDAMEVTRHSVVVGILLRFAILTAFVAALSTLMTRKPWRVIWRAIGWPPRIPSFAPGRD